MERWRSEVIGRILNSGLSPYGQAIRLQQQLGMSWREATAHAGYDNDHPRISESTTHPTTSIPESRKKELLKTYLEAEHVRQARRMAQLYARKLNISEDEYMKALPQFPDQPSSSFNPPSKPLIVEGRRISWREQAGLSGIAIDNRLSVLDDNISDWSKDPKGFTTPEQPFTTWVSIADACYDIPVMRNIFSKGENRAAGILESVAFWNAFPEMVLGDRLILLGSAMSKAGGNVEEEYPLWLDGRSSSSRVSLKPFLPEGLNAFLVGNYPNTGQDIYHVLASKRDIRS